MSEITIFKKSSATAEPHYVDYTESLKRIMKGNSRSVNEAIREETDKSKVRTLKNTLPLVLYAGKFDIPVEEQKRGQIKISYGKEKSLSTHSGLIVLDFDGFSQNTEEFKKYLTEKPFIHAAWISPSGAGVKALVKISQPEKHKEHFFALMEEFPGLLDETGVNINRGCYESYDPNLYYNKDSEVFTKILPVKPQEFKETDESQPVDDQLLSRCVSLILDSIDGEKHREVLKAGKLAGGLVAAHRLPPKETLDALKSALEKRLGANNTRDYWDGVRALEQSFRHGMDFPLYEENHSEEIINSEDFLEDINVLDGEINHFLETGEIMGLPFGDDLLDRHFRLKLGNFNIFLGHANVGKSTFSWYLAMLAAKLHGWTWGIYSSENTLWRLKKKLMEFYLSKPLITSSKEEQEEARGFVDAHFHFITNKNVYTYKDMLNFATRLVEEKDIDAFLIDPYNSLVRKGVDNPHEYDYAALSEFLAWTKRYGKTLWCNMHTVTEAGRRRDSDGLVKRPFAADAEGGGKNVNRCDDLIVIHRNITDQTSRRYTEFYVDKVRETETGGLPTTVDKPIKFKAGDTLCSFLLNGVNLITGEIEKPEMF